MVFYSRCTDGELFKELVLHSLYLLQYQRRLNHVHFFTTSAKASYENIVAAMAHGSWLMAHGEVVSMDFYPLTVFVSESPTRQ